MAQKVVAVNIDSNYGLDHVGINEYVFPELNKYLEEGYKITEKLLPTTPNHGTSKSFTIIFFLEKADNATPRSAKPPYAGGMY